MYHCPYVKTQNTKDILSILNKLKENIFIESINKKSKDKDEQKKEFFTSFFKSSNETTIDLKEECKEVKSKEKIKKSKERTKELYPIIIGSRALQYRMDFNKILKKEGVKSVEQLIPQPKDWDIILTPSHAYNFVEYAKDKTITMTILYMGTSPLNNEFFIDYNILSDILNKSLYYKIYIENGLDSLDLSIITNKEQGIYKLAKDNQLLPNRNVLNTKMIYTDIYFLYFLKQVHIAYPKNLEKNVRESKLLKKYLFLTDDKKSQQDIIDYKKDIFDTFQKEAIIMKGEIPSLPEYNKMLDSNPIISYTLDKYLLSGLTCDIKKAYEDSILLFCTSIGGEKYRDKYASHKVSQYDIDKIQFSWEINKIKRNFTSSTIR